MVTMQQCEDAGKKMLQLVWVNTDKSVDPADKKLRSRSCAGEYKTKKQGKIQRAILASQLFSAMPALEAVTVIVEQRESVEVETPRHQHSAAQRLTHVRFPKEDRQTYGEDKVGMLMKNVYGTQDACHIWQLDYVNLMCRELGGFRRSTHSAALFHNANQDVRMAVHIDH